MSLAWQMVRHRFAGFAGTFLAVALGVAVVAGATTLFLSSQPETPARYAGSPVLVQSPESGEYELGEPHHRPWSAAEATALAGRLAELPGVTAAVPDPSFYVQRLVDGQATGDEEQSRYAGHAWSSAVLGGYRLSAGTAPAAEGQVALSGATPGTVVEVLTVAGPARWTVTGTVDGPGFYVADAAALRRSAGVPVIGLVVDGEPEAVAEAARGVAGADGVVLTGDDRDRLEPGEVTRTRWLGAQLLIAMVAIGGFVAIFVVSSTTALSTAQRRREIALLRAVGATPGQVQRLMYAETLVVAVAGSAVGVLLGAAVAPLLAQPMIDSGLQPSIFTVSVQPLALAGTFALGIVVALLGVWSVARRAGRTPALDALREAEVSKRAMSPLRWVAGLLAAAGGVALLVILPSLAIQSQTTAGMGAAMLLLTAGALLAPVVIVPLVRVVTWPWRRGATGMVVREGTLTGVRRVASTAAPVLLTVGFAMLLTGTVATITEVEGAEELTKIPAVTVATADGTPGLSEAAVAAQPGESQLPTSVLVSHGGTVTGYDAVGRSDAPGLVLWPDTAAEIGAAPGGTVSLRWPDGTLGTLPVAAVDADTPAPVVVPRDLARRHDPEALTSVVMLDGPPRPAPGLRTMSARDYVQLDIDRENQIIDIFLIMLIGLGVGYTGLAVANTLLMATAARRSEFRALRLAGAGTGQVLRVSSAEALLAVGVGTVLGAAVAVTSLTGVRKAVEAELDIAVPLVVPWGASAAVVGICAAVALLATAVPVLRRR
jgi:putative ABC transport system permease protein